MKVAFAPFVYTIRAGKYNIFLKVSLIKFQTVLWTNYQTFI